MSQNWETDYATILNDMSTADIEEFQADPDNILTQYGTSTGELIKNMLQDESDLRARIEARFFDSSDAEATVITHWWGVQILFNEAATQLVQAGVNGASGLATAIAAASPGIPGFGSIVAAISGVLAGAMVIAAAVISYVDQGSGIHFNWNWAQLGALTIPGIGMPVIASMLIPIANAND